MLSGDNSILSRAAEAKKKTEKNGTYEIVQLEVLGSFDSSGKTNLANLKNALIARGATVDGDTFPITVTLNGENFEIDANGNIERKAVTISKSNLTIKDTNGNPVEEGDDVAENTELVINFTASVQDGTVTVSPSLPHTTTSEEMSAKDVEFTLTANVNGETTEEKYKVNLKKIYVSNEMTIEQLQTGAATYFGYDVINYKDTLPIAYQNIEWQLFYAGKINDSDANEKDHIYLIAKDYVPYSLLPTKNSALPLPKGDTDYRTGFSNLNNPNDGVVPQYTEGSGEIGTIGQNLNSKFYKYLSDNSTTSSYNNIKAVAYMLDSDIWGNFKGTNADYAIGGPSVELLFKAYNKYKRLTGSSTYVTDVNSLNGYRISKDNGTNWANYYSSMIEADSSSKDSPYIISSNINAYGYWLASPSARSGLSNVMYVGYDDYMTYGGCVTNHDFGSTYNGFRPLVCVKSNFALEKVKDTNGDVTGFNIVEKSE